MLRMWPVSCAGRATWGWGVLGTQRQDWDAQKLFLSDRGVAKSVLSWDRDLPGWNLASQGTCPQIAGQLSGQMQTQPSCCVSWLCSLTSLEEIVSPPGDVADQPSPCRGSGCASPVSCLHPTRSDYISLQRGHLEYYHLAQILLSVFYKL